MATVYCKSYTDFIGLSAVKYKQELFNHKYIDDICVYSVSANMQNIDKVSAYLHETCLTAFTWLNSDVSSNIKFAKSDDNTFMCYKFQLSDITTDSDTENDIPYSYQEMFNQSVLLHMSASKSMQYSYIWNAYTTNSAAQSAKNEMSAIFCNTNNVASSAEFSREDYYKFFVPETDIVHDHSTIELHDDGLASVSNSAHDSFNCLLFCVNPNYNADRASASNNMPYGFTNSQFRTVPISLCTYSQDIILAGNNVVFEPNLNGIVTVQ